jgi:hypothetical protein
MPNYHDQLAGPICSPFPWLPPCLYYRQMLMPTIQLQVLRSNKIPGTLADGADPRRKLLTATSDVVHAGRTVRSRK